MFDSLLDSISKKVDRIHNVTDVAVAETRHLKKVVESSEEKIKGANEAAEAVQGHLKEAIDEPAEAIQQHLKGATEEMEKMKTSLKEISGELAEVRTRLKEAETQLEMAKFQALETSSVMDTLESLSGNAAQFAQPDSKEIMVQHDPRLFEQSASTLNEKDLRKAVGRLKAERVMLLYSICSDLIQTENEEVE